MKMFWIKKGIPQCEVHPIFGSLTFLQKVNPGTWMTSIYNRYSHPYVGIWVFWRPGLIINCPNLARNILGRDSDNFKNRLLGTGTRDKLGTLNIFTANDSDSYFVKLFRMIVKERGGYEKETEGKRDLMDALLKMKQEAIKDNQNIDEMVLISNAMVFLQGGYETSSTLLCYMTYEMAHKLSYQAVVVVGKNKETYDLETLRKYPVMVWLDRTSLKEYQVDENLTIPAGTVVYVNSNGMHQDPKILPDPMEFKPERFLPENMQSFIPYAYLPFGDGPRSCLGKLFSMFSMRFGFATIISNFILEPLPNAPAPNDVAVQRKGLFYAPGEVLSVKFVPRHCCLPSS